MEKSVILSLFPTWADHFKNRLMEEGIEGLIGQYNNLISDIETQSCAHGKQGKRLFNDDYSNCCGVSYEYYNNISTRKALQIISDKIPLSLSDKQKNKIKDIDLRLQKLINENPENNPDDINFSKKYWWEEVLPKGIIK